MQVALPYMPLYALAACCSLSPAGFLARMELDFDPVRIWTFVWCVFLQALASASCLFVQ